jgi:hypothetical protein
MVTGFGFVTKVNDIFYIDDISQVKFLALVLNFSLLNFMLNVRRYMMVYLNQKMAMRID